MTGEAARLHIDWTACDGRGLCVELLPDALTRDQWGYPIARRAQTAGERSNVPLRGDELDGAVDAVKLCPVLALKLLRPASS